MAGGRKYPDGQIEWVLDNIVAGRTSQQIIAEFKTKFNSPHFGKAQFKYLKNTYGDHPDFGCRFPNRGAVTTPAEAQAAVERLALDKMLQNMLSPDQVHPAAHASGGPAFNFADFNGTSSSPASQPLTYSTQSNLVAGDSGQKLQTGQAVDHSQFDFGEFKQLENDPENFSYEDLMREDHAGKESTTIPQPDGYDNPNPQYGVGVAIGSPFPATSNAGNQASNIFNFGISSPFAKRSESAAPEAPMLEIPTAPSAMESFPSPPNHSMVDNQASVPPSRPYGCTAASRSGWDTQGWWYRGVHDACAVPVVHRHDCVGQVTFAGYDDVLSLVRGLEAYRQEQYSGTMYAGDPDDEMEV